MKFPKKVDIDVNEDFYDRIKVKQNDTARYLLFNLLDNGVPFDLENKTVRVYGLKPDGTKVFNNLTIINAARGLAELQLTTQMLVKPGCLKLELVIYEATDILSTTKFDIDIISCLRDDAAIESTNEFSALTLGLSKLDEWDKYFKETSGKIEEKYTERLNGIDSSLENKMNKTDNITVSQIDKNKGKIDQTYLTDELLQQMAGTTPINSVPARSSLGFDKLNWFDVVYLNLHNKDTDTIDKIVQWGDGILTTVTGYKASDYIEIQGGKKYCNDNSLTCAFYDKDKIYVSGLNAGFTNPYTAPSNAKYVRHTYQSTKDGVLCEGESLVKPTAYYLENIIKLKSTDFENIIIQLVKNANLNELEWIEVVPSINLYDKSVESQGYVQKGNGIFVSDDNYRCSDYISVNQGEKIVANTEMYYAFYDEFKKYVAGGDFPRSSNLEVPVNAKFIRVTFGKSINAMVIKGDTLPIDYIPFGSTLSFKNDFRNQMLNALKPATKLKWGQIGDSITRASNYMPDGYINVVAKELNLDKYNYGIDGSSIHDGFEPMYLRYTSMASDLDIITVAGGTNDSSATIGTMADRTGATLYGACHILFSGLINKYPNACIGVILPTPRDLESMDKLKEKTKAIKEVAEYYALPTLDLLSNCNGMSCAIDSRIATLYSNADKLHPSAYSHKNLIAPLVVQFIEKMIKMKRV